MAANTQGICYSFKTEMLGALHNLFAGGNNFKAALYFQNQSLGPVTTAAYSATGEVTGTNYTAGGIAVSNATGVQSSSGITYWTPSANFVWNSLTIASPFDTALIYNATNGNRAVMVITFTAQTVANTQFTITMPSNTNTSALIQVS